MINIKTKTTFRADRTAAAKIENLPKLQALLKVKAETINGVAKLIFLSQVKHTHPVTPPPYATSFKVRRAVKGARRVWQAYNDDPAAKWVEFGAYTKTSDGHPMILRYRPFGRALDVVSKGGG